MHVLFSIFNLASGGFLFLFVVCFLAFACSTWKLSTAFSNRLAWSFLYLGQYHFPKFLLWLSHLHSCHHSSRCFFFSEFYYLDSLLLLGSFVLFTEVSFVWGIIFSFASLNIFHYYVNIIKILIVVIFIALICFSFSF